VIGVWGTPTLSGIGRTGYRGWSSDDLPGSRIAADGGLDSLDADNFKYSITARETASGE